MDQLAEIGRRSMSLFPPETIVALEERGLGKLTCDHNEIGRPGSTLEITVWGIRGKQLFWLWIMKRRFYMRVLCKEEE